MVGQVHSRIVIAVPCLDEREHIAAVLRGLSPEAETLDAQVLVLDGGSTDGTREIVLAIAADNPRIRLVANPKRRQGAAINLAAQMARDSEYLIRVDAHCGYPPEYCRTLIEECEATGAASVVVSLDTQGETCFQRAVAAAQNSALGNGGSPHRLASSGRFVNHGHHALFRTPVFLSVGGYDERFTHNEDAELDHRLGQAGHRIWLTSRCAAVYYPRSSPSKLFSQYVNYGRGRARTVVKHRIRPALRQLAPMSIAPVLLLALASFWWWPAILPAVGWTLSCIAYGLAIGVRGGSLCEAMSGPAAMIMHFAWSLGFWLGLLRRGTGR